MRSASSSNNITRDQYNEIKSMVLYARNKAVATEREVEVMKKELLTINQTLSELSSLFGNESEEFESEITRN
jgi:hypothetical protein